MKSLKFIKRKKRELISYFVLNGASSVMGIYLIFASLHAKKYNTIEASLYYPTVVYFILFMITIILFIILLLMYNKLAEEEIYIFKQKIAEKKRKEQEKELEKERVELFYHGPWEEL